MDGEQDRRCGFIACVGYADEAGRVRVFEEPRPYFGTMRETRAAASEGSAVGRAWGSQLFEIFVPDDAAPGGLTLAEMSKDQLNEYRRNRNSAFKAFAHWWRNGKEELERPREGDLEARFPSGPRPKRHKSEQGLEAYGSEAGEKSLG
eukprot:UN4856